MKLSEAIRLQGFQCKVMKHPARVKGGLGKGFAHMQARCYRNGNGQLGMAIMSDSWDHAYSASHEIAELEYGFNHSAHMFCMQANILARWIRLIASEGSE